ncbi:hypothetical protein [Brevundimonas sp.]|uniref:hypothetical protein n=1 Tax=Brevundimonas sp. TaxID=1871086 RepID=UPI002D4632BE|nr:hypothetical protein [Brevundimonas sp.]HYC67989.1 hypothetical protein [Brevundimonas sp.]
MTDPNLPPRDDRPEVVHHTTINNPSTGGSGGAGWIGFLVGGLVVVLVIIAIVVFSNGGLNRATDTKVDLDVDLPAPSLPEAPKMPELPDVEPPSVPNPDPAT